MGSYFAADLNIKRSLKPQVVSYDLISKSQKILLSKIHNPISLLYSVACFGVLE